MLVSNFSYPGYWAPQEFSVIHLLTCPVLHELHGIKPSSTFEASSKASKLLFLGCDGHLLWCLDICVVRGRSILGPLLCALLSFHSQRRRGSISAAGHLS